MNKNIEKFDGPRRLRAALAQWSGEELWQKIFALADQIRVVNIWTLSGAEPDEYTIDDSDRTILAVVWLLKPAAQFFIAFKDIEPLFQRVVELLKFVLENGCTSTEQIPGFEKLRWEFKRAQDEILARPEYKRPDDWEPDH